MSTGVVISDLPYYGDLAQNATDDPYLFEIVAPIESESTNEAVRQATARAESLVNETRDEILGNVPTDLNTLELIASAIANDPNFVATIQAKLDAKANKAVQIQVSGLATGGGDLSTDRNVGVPGATSDDAIAGVATDKAITPVALSALITHLFQTPGVLEGLLPKTRPADSGVPWLDGRMVVIS